MLVAQVGELVKGTRNPERGTWNVIICPAWTKVTVQARKKQFWQRFIRLARIDFGQRQGIP
jgi:hypothetical protein